MVSPKMPVVEDEVLLDQVKGKKINNKYLNRLESTIYKVKHVNGSMVTVVDKNRRELTRDKSFF